MNLAALRHRIILKRGSDLLRQEKWQKASALLGRAAKLAPDHWESHNNLAIAFLKLGRWEEAAGMAQRAIRLSPRSADSHDFFGIALLQMERWEEAVVAYRRAVTVDPARYDSYDRLGVALLRLQRWSDVVDVYEEALKRDADRYTAHQRLGLALLHLGRWQRAAAAFRRAIDLAGTNGVAPSEVAGLLSNLASALGQTDASREALSELQGNAPADVAARVSAGVELLKLERWHDADAELAAAGSLAPEAGAAPFLRVDALIRLGRLDESVAAHRQAIAAGGDMPVLPRQPAAKRLARRRAEFWSPRNLGPDVFAIERWLEQLSTMPAQVPPGPRLLFVLDNDFGELTTVKYFLLGQELAARSTLLLPDRLYAHNADTLPGRTHRYASVNDILQVVDREHPAVVFLCSGYLLWDHLAFTANELEHLVDGLRARGCRIVTADPFLGMLSRQDPRTLITIDVPTSHPVWTAEQLRETKRPVEERMRVAFAESERILRDTHHVYPAGGDVPVDDAAKTDERNLAFFNSHLVRPPSRTRDTTVTPHWLFVLTGADCGVQMLYHGEAGFADLVASKLVETVAAGRHPILIAPGDFIEKLMPRMPTAEGIDVLPYAPFIRFMSLLLGAEHVFYWNAVSHSLLIRLFNQQPIVLFDRGHLLRNAGGIRDRIVRWYYQGWEPPIRDHRERLTLDTVNAWVEEYGALAARLVNGFRRAPSPAKLVADLVGTPALVAAGIPMRPEQSART